MGLYTVPFYDCAVLDLSEVDMKDERVISYERGKHLADSLGLEFFETSAKENINVRVSIEEHRVGQEPRRVSIGEPRVPRRISMLG